MTIDLRSDTVTKPTQDMMEAMMAAQVGDDVFGEDPTIKALEQKTAAIFGMDGGLFCPSGTMTNQIAIKILTQPYDEVICYSGAHIYKYEGGGVMGNSGVSVRLLDGDRGVITSDEISQNINPDDAHLPKTSVVSLENTVNKGGGCFYHLGQIKKISDLCINNNIKLHLDGARVFNAIVETDEDPKEFGKYFDTISVCLSKGLGAPVGSVLLYKEQYAKQAHRMRKVFGGGMRQAGYLAAAGIYALDHHVDRLKEDHKRAKQLEEVLISLPYVEKVIPVQTNILIFELAGNLTAKECIDKLEEKGVKSVAFGYKEVRFVTHLDFNDAMLEQTINVLKEINL
ncbi:MAG: beta-eliminating lyase-related protein [Cyclobacteriaceae bacterium]|nr:beta-eliminating lyase-related protein [Cyclobacteriaceae bacterium]